VESKKGIDWVNSNEDCWGTVFWSGKFVQRKWKVNQGVNIVVSR
jgi:hypothetical protein